MAAALAVQFLLLCVWGALGSSDCDEVNSRALLQRKTSLDHLAQEVSLEKENRSTLFPGCAAPRKFAVKQAPAVMVTVNASRACEITLKSFTATSYTDSCCPVGSLQCAGCARYTSYCAICSGGFMQQNGKCTSCADTVGWVNRQGLTCAQLTSSDCDQIKVKGLSSSEACCICGGGSVLATPFSYDMKHWALGESVSLHPKPRTAERYSVNEGCELVDHNLTLNGNTGEISTLPGKSIMEAFSLECTVTAHQAAGVSYESTVRVAADYLAYGLPLLLFSAGKSFPVRKAAGAWKDFGVSCAPQANWLSIAADGTLSRGSSVSKGGVDTEDPDLAGQMGGVCVVTAQNDEEANGKWREHKVKVVAVWPQPWPDMAYEHTALSVTLGEQLPVLKPYSPAAASQPDERWLKPSEFFVACDTTPSLTWSYDTLLGTGLLEGYYVLEVAADGSISVSVAREMSSIFDSISDNSARKKVTLSCGVWGSFPDGSAPIHRSLKIDIWDDVCWVWKRTKEHWRPVPEATSEQACRAKCRQEASCASFRYWSNGGCGFYRNHESIGNNAWGIAKVTNCTAEATCQEVSTGTWYESGLYCPVAPDLYRGDVLYLKPGETKEETLYLAKYSSSIDGVISGCSDGNWILRQAHPDKDYIKMESGEVELRGRVLKCLTAGVTWGVASCGAPNISVPDEGYMPMVVDDPMTSAGEDYWLHPCDCAPPAWGMEKPVNPESFESVPGKSGNIFIPSPFELVSGQFVCPAKQLLDDGVHFETASEAMERSDCEARCKAHDNCYLFWHGSQQGANTCRLYSSCMHLVREMGLEGRLVAVPRSLACQVADPEKCWSTSLRRASLTSGASQPFWYWGLHVTCDEALLLGGVGVETCARPTYRNIDSHEWQHKKQLPQSFLHGSELTVKCWRERYTGVQGASSAAGVSLYCVNGEWFNQHNEKELGDFSCEGCLQVGSTGFKEVEMRNEQEIWHMNRMQMSLLTEVLDSTQSQVHCLRFAGSGELELRQQSWCGSVFTAEFNGVTSSDSRLVRMLEQSGQCLEEAMYGVLPIGIHANCNAWSTAQQIPMEDMPGMLWRIHTKDHEEAGHRLRPALIDCWGRGAIGKVDMMHLFNTNHAQTASYIGRVLVPGSSSGYGNGHWYPLSAKAFGWPLVDHPGATEVRVCLIYADSAQSSTGVLHTRLRRIDTAGGTVFFSDSWPVTWSGTGLYHHRCGTWHSLANVHCGYSWGDTCQLDFTHSTKYHIVSAELEFGSNDPALARAFRGRWDVPASYHGTVSANVWTSISQRFGFAKQDYPDATYFRACVVFTDDSQAATSNIRVTRPHTGHVWFEDYIGHTWSASGLIHAECGPWHSLSNIECGYAWTNDCRLELKSTASIPMQVFEVDLELKGDSADISTAYLGRQKILGSVHGATSTSSWFKVGGIIHINTDTYPTATDLRACVLFTDSSSGGGNAHVRMRRTDQAGGTVFFEENLGSTWSGSGLHHMECGAWRPVSSISCGASWGTSCQIDARHGQGVQMTISSMFLEYRSSLSRDVCRFAPVINRLAHSEVAIFKIGPWSDWQYRLSDAPIYCPEGRILTDLDARHEQYLTYSCGTVAGLGSCTEGFTAQADVQDWTSFLQLGTLSIICPQDALLNGFHFEFSEGGKWIRFRYTCCNAAGAPTAMLPQGPQAPPAVEGLYCPVARDESGRLVYEQGSGQVSFLEGKSSVAAKRLQFNPIIGEWCIEGSCTDVDGSVVPAGLSSATFDIVAVSDFDGVFEGKGVPKQGGSPAALKARLRGIKNPKRPKAPKVPKLEKFVPEEPTYAAECMDYNRLWTSIQESYKDAEGVVTPHMNNLKAEPAYDLSETNPCEVAAAVSGTRGKIGGGDGRSTGEKMNYVELDGCAARVVARDLEMARRERDSAIFETVMDVASESIDLICDVPPNVETAPMGMGAEFQPEDWCSDGKDLADAMILMTNYHGGIGLASSIYNVEAEDNADCDPLQAGLDRLFCDIHCVRDAVVRGDRAILRNLQSATEVTNKNMKKMVEWSVAANRAETGWLAAKIDTTEERLSIRVQMVQDALAAANTGALQEATEVSEAMLGELATFAAGASSVAEKRTALSALRRYLGSAPRLEAANTSAAALQLQQLQRLHGALAAGAGRGQRSKAEVLAKQWSREAQHLEEAAKMQLQVLGVYRQHAETTSRQVRGWTRQAQRQALVEVDRIWWEMRSKLDAYLEAAELQTQSFMESLTTLGSFQHCSSSLQRVQKSYAKALATRDMGHAVLRETWRESKTLFGELSAVIVDGEVFKIFYEAEGCNSTLVKQTMKQVKYAVGALGLLKHRFQAGGLEAPDARALLQSVRRIQDSRKLARAQCGEMVKAKGWMGHLLSFLGL